MHQSNRDTEMKSRDMATERQEKATGLTALCSDCGCLSSSPKCQTHVSNYRGFFSGQSLPGWFPSHSHRHIMELNVTPLQFRAVTYAAVVNKTHSWRETRLRVREEWAVVSRR